MGQSTSSRQANVTGDSRQVKTKYGSVVGRRFGFGEKEVDAFQGIPFAKPPVGDLRFKKPIPPVPWEGVRETKKFAARGIQKDMSLVEKIKLGQTSEDNLYLNVFTPTWSPSTASGFATLVFIHGGGFVCDSTVKYGDVGICEHLCTKDVVVVTLQYRIGLLGFFSTGDQHCLGNFGLWDQTEALKWVKDNIAYFNGDPDNITVMGQSAGGASVDLLSICPHSRDLFHKVIPMAGNAGCSFATHDDMVEESRKFAESHGVEFTLDSAKMIESLRGLAADKFALSLFESLSKSPGSTRCPCGPRIDGDFIPKSVSELRREAPPKPMLIGCCESEGLIFTATAKPPSTSLIMEIIASLFSEAEYPIIFKKLREQLFQKMISNPKDQMEVKRAYVEIFGKEFTNGAQQTVVETLEANDVPVFFYSFDYCNPKSWGPLSLRWPFKEATHCTEIAYIFAVGIIWSFEFNDDDKRMLELTTRMWTNFAKYGDPNGIAADPATSPAPLSPEAFTWEPTTLSNPQRHLSISLQPQMKDTYKKGVPLFVVETNRERDGLSKKL